MRTDWSDDKRAAVERRQGGPVTFFIIEVRSVA
jgi:hypothetical protein